MGRSKAEEIETTISIDTSSYQDPNLTLRFRTCYAMQSANDAGYLEARTNNVGWTRVATYTNSTPHWSTESVDLSDFSDAAYLKLRFNVNSQSEVLWYVDDVYLDARFIHSVYLPVILR